MGLEGYFGDGCPPKPPDIVECQAPETDGLPNLVAHKLGCK